MAADKEHVAGADADADGVTLVQKMLAATTGSVLTSLLGTCERLPVPAHAD
jgi:hypothetical protein